MPKIVKINPDQLRSLLRMKPTLEDTAAFFDCSPDTIELYIKKNYDCTFTEFRRQNMVHTRHSLIRTAIQKAEDGDNEMLKFTIKNLAGWRDRPKDEEDEANDKFKNMSDVELRNFVKRLLGDSD